MGLLYSFGSQGRRVLLFAPLQWMEVLRNRMPAERMLPLVVMLHDAPFVAQVAGIDPATPEGFAALTRMHEIPTGTFTPGGLVEEQDLFFTLYIAGAELTVGGVGPSPVNFGRNGWNSGHMFMEALIAGADDVAFIQNAIAKCKAFVRAAMKAVTGFEPPVFDDARRYVVGMGNGARWSTACSPSATCSGARASWGAASGVRP